MKQAKLIKTMSYAAMCLALALILPFLTAQIPEIGQALSPMHIPAFLCGFICGPIWGLVVGFIAPLLRSVLFTMPPMAAAIPMAFEMAMYGLSAGILYRLRPKKLPFLYVSLVGSMVCGRIVWGIVQLIMSVARAESFTFSAFIAGTVTGTIPGIICHIIIVPLVIFALQRARLMPDNTPTVAPAKSADKLSA